VVPPPIECVPGSRTETSAHLLWRKGDSIAAIVRCRPTSARRRHGQITRAPIPVRLPHGIGQAPTTAVERKQSRERRRDPVPVGELGSARAMASARTQRGHPGEARATRGSGTRRVHRNSKSPSGRGQAPSLHPATQRRTNQPSAKKGSLFPRRNLI
jgi:hypothetical protein